MVVVLSVRAEQDLEDIGDRIAADNPERALSFVREPRQRCAQIELSPQRYQLRPELGAGIRLCIHRRCLIVFRMDDSGVFLCASHTVPGISEC